MSKSVFRIIIIFFLIKSIFCYGVIFIYLKLQYTVEILPLLFNLMKYDIS